ncbi:MAG: 4Fe-4S binding protein [Candidatus Tenebribacter mawsonii]|nr:4Fe-4S binding protein [Candidatus Tenebribacter mawsonii]
MKRIWIILILIVITIISIGCDKVNNPEYNVDKSACNSCGACIGICPIDAIEIGADGKAIIDQTKCNQCGKCIAICPEDAIY